MSRVFYRGGRGPARPQSTQPPRAPEPDVPLRMLQMGSSPHAIQVRASALTGRTVWLPERLLKDIRLSPSTEPLPPGAQSWITFFCPYWLVAREHLEVFHHDPAEHAHAAPPIA